MSVLKMFDLVVKDETLATLREQYDILDDRWIDSSVGFVAVYDAHPTGHFTVYVGATEGRRHDDEKYLIAWKGNKITDVKIARAIFPDIQYPYKNW